MYKICSKLTRKFEWTLDYIKVENSVPIWATIFFEVSALLDVRQCPKLQSAIKLQSKKTNHATLTKWQKP